MEIIRSFDNKKIKHVSKLKDKNYREETAQYYAEGLKWVADAIKYGTASDIVDYVLVKESKAAEYIDKLNGFERVFAVDDGIFDRISDTQNNQGILAVLNMIKPDLPLNSKRVLYLDRIRDPGNMGTLIRTACAAGYTDIICDNCVDVYNPKVIRSCMTAVLHVSVYSDFRVSLEEIKALGYSIYAADADGSNVFELKSFPEKLALVIGNEADGISKSISESADMLVSIPMSENIESLNAAVSAAILMYNLKKY